MTVRSLFAALLFALLLPLHATAADRVRVFSLQGRPIRVAATDDDPDFVAPRRCRTCGHVFVALAKVCPKCGAYSSRSKTRRERDAELRRVTELQVRRASVEQCEVWAELSSRASRSGFKPGWAKFMFKQRFGFWPSKAVMSGAKTRGWVAA